MLRLLRSLTPFLLLAGVAACAATAAGATSTRTLSLAQRIAAQEAIERVYYRHQKEAARPFERAVPRALLERKMLDSLAKSVFLERRWDVTIDDAALQRELQRIAAATRLPERLREIYDALGNDPRLVKEAFVRPVLVDRLARSRFACDAAAGEVARVAWDEWWAASRGSFLGLEPRGESESTVPLPAPLARVAADGAASTLESRTVPTEVASCFTDDT